MHSMTDNLFIDPQTFFYVKNIKDDNALIIARTQCHLEQLFNSRKNSTVHMPGYGLSDLYFVYQNLPYSLQNLSCEIKNLITSYEKNITEFSLQANNIADINIVLSFSLLCKINHTIDANFLIKFYQNRFVTLTFITDF